MFHKKNIKDSLIEIKKQLETEYISIFNDGSYTIDKGNSIINAYTDELNQACSDLDYFLKKPFEILSTKNVNYDNLSYDFRMGLIFKKDELGDNNEILPISEPVEGKVRYYTEDIHAYLGDELTEEIGISQAINYQGIIDYDKVVKQFKNNGFSFNGPETYDELYQMIINKEKFNISVGLDFNQKNDESMTLSMKK